MNVDAVNGEGLEAGDLQLALRHGLLQELVLSFGRLLLGAAGAVSGCVGGRVGTGVAKGLVAPHISGVSNTKNVSTAPICRSTGVRTTEKEKMKRNDFVTCDLNRGNFRTLA